MSWTRLGCAAVCCQWRNCSLICAGLVFSEASSASLISRQGEVSSRPTSCRNPSNDVSRLDCICVMVAVLTWPLHLYCSTARIASTAARAGTAIQRKIRSLTSDLTIYLKPGISGILCKNYAFLDNYSVLAALRGWVLRLPDQPVTAVFCNGFCRKVRSSFTNLGL